MGLLDSDHDDLKKKSSDTEKTNGTGRKKNLAGLGAFKHLKGINKYSDLTAKYRTNAPVEKTVDENVPQNSVEQTHNKPVTNIEQTCNNDFAVSTQSNAETCNKRVTKENADEVKHVTNVEQTCNNTSLDSDSLKDNQTDETYNKPVTEALSSDDKNLSSITSETYNNPITNTDNLLHDLNTENTENETYNKHVTNSENINNNSGLDIYFDQSTSIEKLVNDTLNGIETYVKHVTLGNSNTNEENYNGEISQANSREQSYNKHVTIELNSNVNDASPITSETYNKPITIENDLHVKHVTNIEQTCNNTYLDSDSLKDNQTDKTYNKHVTKGAESTKSKNVPHNANVEQTYNKKSVSVTNSIETSKEINYANVITKKAKAFDSSIDMPASEVEFNAKLNSAEESVSPTIYDVNKSKTTSYNKHTTIIEQTGNKPVTNIEHLYNNHVSNIEQTYVTSYNKPVTDFGDSKTISALTLSGTQKQIMFFIFDQCSYTASTITPRIASDLFGSSLGISVGVLRTSINRLVEKGFVSRYSVKDGRGGWTQYQIPDFIYKEISNLKKSNIENYTKHVTQPISQPVTKSSSKIVSNNYNNISNYTQSEKEQFIFNEDLLAVSFEPVYKYGLRESAIDDIRKNKWEITRAQLESLIEKFPMYMEDPANKKSVSKMENPRAIFFGLIKTIHSSKGKIDPLDFIKSESDQALDALLEKRRLVLEEAKKRKQEQMEIEFEIWMTEKSREELELAFKPSQFAQFGSEIYKAGLKQYFLENEWRG